MRTHEAGALHADVTEPPSALLVPPADPGTLAAAVWPATNRKKLFNACSCS